MPVNPYPAITDPLTDSERALLLSIYQERRRNLLAAYAVLMCLAFVCSFRGIDFRTRYTRKVIRWEEQGDSKYVSRQKMQLINLLWLETPLVITGIYFWRKRVLPCKRDIELGVKELVPFTVSGKQHFPITGQYFLSLDDTEYLHHEVDADHFYAVSVGDTIFLPRAIHLQHIFQKDGRHTVV